jgi:hypothetical protein
VTGQIAAEEHGVFHPAGGAAQKARVKARQLHVARGDLQHIQIRQTGQGPVDPLIGGDDRPAVHHHEIAPGVALLHVDRRFPHLSGFFQDLRGRDLQVVDQVLVQTRGAVGGIFRVGAAHRPLGCPNQRRVGLDPHFAQKQVRMGGHGAPDAGVLLEHHGIDLLFPEIKENILWNIIGCVHVSHK